VRHPFQRQSNKRDTVQTPFQRVLVHHIESCTRGGEKMSGRRLSRLLGKSANHISQMLNDGFVPSGPAILDMAGVLELDQAGLDMLIRAAMQTKADQRSRDNFWITETHRMLEEMEDRESVLLEFLKQEGLEEAFADWSTRRRRRRKTSRRGSLKKK